MQESNISWVQLFDADGDPYYWNVNTDETTFTKPEFFSTLEQYESATGVVVEMDSNESKLVWQRVYTPDGEPYYWNTATDETQFEVPPDFVDDTEVPDGNHTEVGKNFASDSESVKTHSENTQMLLNSNEPPQDASPSSNSEDCDTVANVKDHFTTTSRARVATSISSQSIASTVYQGDSSASTTTQPIKRIMARPNLNISIEDDAKIFGVREFTDFLKYFFEIDTERTGYISKTSMRAYAAANGYQMDEEELNALIADKDLNGDGKISLAEYLNASGRMVPLEQSWPFSVIFDFMKAPNQSKISRATFLSILESLEVDFDFDDITHWIGAKTINHIDSSTFTRVFVAI